MAETYAYHSDAIRIDGFLCEFDKLDDPGVVIKCCVSRTSDENRIDFVEGWIRVQFVHDIVALDSNKIFELLRLCSFLQECGKDTRVATEAIASLGLRGVSFEDGETKRRHFGQGLM
jgi:hypothetical protein